MPGQFHRLGIHECYVQRVCWQFTLCYPSWLLSDNSAYLQDLGTVHPVASALAHNLSWVDQVIQHSFMHLQPEHRKGFRKMAACNPCTQTQADTQQGHVQCAYFHLITVMKCCSKNCMCPIQGEFLTHGLNCSPEQTKTPSGIST